MEAKATAKFIRMSPRKTRLVVDLIRGLSVEDARAQLRFSPKQAAQPILKVLNSAVANAEHNNGANTEGFRITEAYVNEGPTFYRYTPRAQGRATPIRKRMSHISIVVGDGKGEEEKKETAVVEKKEEKPVQKKTAPKKKVKKVEESEEGTKKKKETAKA